MEYEVVRYKKRERKKRKVSKITGEKIYSRSELEDGLWDMFSLFIRMRDKNTCVLAHLGGCSQVIQAGHVIPRTKKPTKYDERNVYAQCKNHNYLHSKANNTHIYTGWFIEKFGAELYTELCELSRQDAKALTPKQLIEMTTLYAKKIESLKPRPIE